ncbi:hypothetical protein BCR35DRAFT_307413 [Leucosporidium creatinivorum]|uniref:Uncharacterized protein n=1 Tax=Leucosporidium creatinivorum TaxID=106004 RepID=A0A1Y2EMW0_9BASI|nr:hypothetical protein BCR35DRAFT_307413 [Leucosporidium creatinivorum]
MLETVRSRRIYGFLVLTILPTSAAIGYYLRDRKDSLVTQEATSSTAPSPSVVGDRIKMLRRHEAELAKEAQDIREKLERVKGKLGEVKV